jgi:hypothetical protein
MRLFGAALIAAFACYCTAAGAQTVEELKQEHAAKNAKIKELEQQLENSTKGTRSAVFSRHSLAGTPSTFSKRITESQPKDSFSRSAPTPVQSAAPSATQSPAGSATTARAQANGVPPRDDEELDRALERTLVREGALVLPPWVFEVTPQFSYSHWDTVQDPYVRNSYSGALTVRAGLPWTSQIAVSVPYTYSEFRDGSSDSGFSDVGVLLSKELLLESDWRPNLVGSVGWTSPTHLGNTFGPVPYVSGFQAGLTASKRIDPLVLFGGVSYFSAASRDVAGTNVNPADVVATRVGASLALSPASAITAGFNLTYLANAHSYDFVVPNSDRLLTTVDVGYTTILWKRTLLNVTGQFGVTGHVPDFRIVTSIPIRF